MTEVTVASIRALDAEEWLRTHDIPTYVLEYIERIKDWEGRVAVFGGADGGSWHSPLRRSQ